MSESQRAQLAKAGSKADKRSSVTGSNMKAMVGDSIAALPAAEQKKCDAEKLFLFVARDPEGPHCHTAEDVLAETAEGSDSLAALKAKVEELGIGTAGFVDSLHAIADKTD